MKWTTEIYHHDDPAAPPTIENTTIERDTIVDGLQAMVMQCSYNDLTAENSMVVRTDGDKVYFKAPDKLGGEWLLMYDFGLREGDGCYIYNPVSWRSNGKLFKSYMKCVETNAQDTRYNGLSTLTVKEYRTEACDDLYPGEGVWLKGIAAVNGVLYNDYYGADGWGALLQEAALNGEVIYSKEATSIQNIDKTQMNIRIDGLTVCVCNAQKADKLLLYSTDGRLMARTQITGNDARLALPKAGTYVLKVGNQTWKILTR